MTSLYWDNPRHLKIWARKFHIKFFWFLHHNFYFIMFYSIILWAQTPLLSPVHTSCQAPFVFQPSLSASLSHLGLMELRFTNLPWMWTLLECQTAMTSLITRDHWVYFSWKWSSYIQTFCIFYKLSQVYCLSRWLALIANKSYCFIVFHCTDFK